MRKRAEFGGEVDYLASRRRKHELCGNVDNVFCIKAYKKSNKNATFFKKMLDKVTNTCYYICVSNEYVTKKQRNSK